MLLQFVFLPGVDNFQIRDANVVITTIFLDIDSVLGDDPDLIRPLLITKTQDW